MLMTNLDKCDHETGAGVLQIVVAYLGSPEIWTNCCKLSTKNKMLSHLGNMIKLS